MVRDKTHKTYGTYKRDVLFVLYFITIILWGFMIIFLSLCDNLNMMALFILFIPIVMFTITIINLDYISPLVEEELTRNNVLSAGMLILLPILTGLTKNYTGNTRILSISVVLAIVFTLLAMIDIWTSEKWITLTRHIKSIFQTLALTMIIFSLYLYYDSTNLTPWTCNIDYTS